MGHPADDRIRARPRHSGWSPGQPCPNRRIFAPHRVWVGIHPDTVCRATGCGSRPQARRDDGVTGWPIRRSCTATSLPVGDSDVYPLRARIRRQLHLPARQSPVPQFEDREIGIADLGEHPSRSGGRTDSGYAASGAGAVCVTTIRPRPSRAVPSSSRRSRRGGDPPARTGVRGRRSSSGRSSP